MAPDPIPHQIEADSLMAALPGTYSILMTVVRLASRTHGSSLTSNASLVSSDKTSPFISDLLLFANKHAPKNKDHHKKKIIMKRADEMLNEI